ncbi:MAG: hypothetical protein ACTJLL_02800, partial [Anaplasma sp.]
IGKLNEDVVYFDVNASSTNYTHHFHYGDNVIRSIPPPKVDSLISVSREESEQMLLGLTRQGFVYYTRDNAPRDGRTILVESVHDLRNFLRNAEAVLNGKAEQLKEEFVLKFALDGKKVCDERINLGCTFGVSAILGNTLRKLSLKSGDIVFSSNALELVYLPDNGTPKLLCADGLLGERAVMKVMDGLPLVHHQKIGEQPAITTVSLHNEVLVEDNSLPSQPLRQKVAADAMDEEDSVDYAGEEVVELPVPPANTPPAPDNTQKPHEAVVTESKDAAAPEALPNRGPGGTVTLPLILGPEVFYDPKSRITQYQIKLKVHDKAYDKNPALSLLKYSFKTEEEVVVESAGQYGYAFSLIPNHQFLKVVQGSEGEYSTVFCNAQGQELAKVDFTDAGGTGHESNSPLQKSSVSQGFTDFLEDGDALKVGRMLVAGKGFKLMDLQSVYDAGKSGPHFRLVRDPGSNQVAAVKYDAAYPGDDDRALLNPEYALFEHNDTEGKCTLFLRSATGWIPTRYGFPAADRGTTFSFPLETEAYKATISQSRTATLEKHPIYGVVSNSEVHFTSFIGDGIPEFEDEKHARSFLQHLLDNGDRDPTVKYAVRIVATDKHAAQLQGIGVKIGQEEVLPLPIRMKNSAGNTVTLGLSEKSPLKIEFSVHAGKDVVLYSWNLTELYRNVLSEFLSRKAFFEFSVGGEDANVLWALFKLPEEAQEVMQGRAILSSMLTSNEDSIVGRSAGEFLQKIRKVRHVDNVDEPVTNANALPVTHTVTEPDATHTPPKQPAPESDESAATSEKTDEPVTQLPVPFEIVTHSKTVLPLHIDPKDEEPVLEAIIRHKDKLLSVPKAAYFFSEDGQLMALAHEFPTTELPLLDRYAKIVTQPNGRYAVQICDEHGNTSLMTHQDMQELYIEPDIFMDDWSLRDMYKSTRGAPAFLLQRSTEGIGERVRVDLVPAPKNYLSTEHQENGHVAHLNAEQMVFSLDNQRVDGNTVTLEYKSALASKRAQREVSVAWRYDEDATNPKHDQALRTASNEQPLYLVVSGNNIAWTLDKDEENPTFFSDQLILSWAKDTLMSLGEDLEQRHTLVLTLGESTNTQQVIVARALLEDGTLS